MNKLPDYFVIRREAENPLWNKYIAWMDNTYGVNWYGGAPYYYGYNGYNRVAVSASHFVSPYPTVITLEQWDEIVNGFVLPEKWCIDSRYLNEKDQDIVLDFIHKTSLYNFKEYVGNYIPHFNNLKFENGFLVKHDYTEITFEQFKKHILKMEDENKFKLPEEWVVKVGDLDKTSIFSQWRETTKYGEYLGSNGYLRNDGFFISNPLNYPKITFEQFEKYVLKQETMEKKIVRYKLKDGCEKYLPILEKVSACFSETVNDYSFSIYSIYYNDFKEAHVLDLWFDPIYEDDKPNITINGYKAEFFDTYVKFGCAEISKEVFFDLVNAKNYSNTNIEVESVTIGKGIFSKNDIKQIAEYYQESI